jgi:DNA gyrase subunit A
VGDIRVIGRNTQGITIFRVGEGEHVVSAARIDENAEPENEAEAMIAEERAESTEPLEADQVQLDDGTGPHTLDERVQEDDEGA